MTLDSLDRTAYAAVAITTNAISDAVGSELTFLAWRTLVVLGNAPGPMRLSDLALGLRVSRPSASKLVRRLQHRSLVGLGPNPADGRGLLIALAPEGRRVREAVTERRRQLLGEALAAPLPATFDEGIAEVARRLDRWI